MDHGILIAGNNVKIINQGKLEPLNKEQARQVADYAAGCRRLASENGGVWCPDSVYLEEAGFYFQGMETLEKWNNK
jgi:hypothetical protein